MTKVVTINSTPTINKVENSTVNSNPSSTKTEDIASTSLEKQPETDTFVSETVPNDIENTTEIGAFRVITNLLTDEQVAEINRTKRLPDNAKFVMTPGGAGYSIVYDFMGLRTGTKTLPEGFEVKKNVMGLAVVVPKDSEGLLIKK